MAGTESEALELTYPLRAAARLTGLSPELLRAWERRYGVVEPMRTPGGTRRYTAADLERLRLVKAAVDAGQRIGDVASLDLEALKRHSTLADPPARTSSWKRSLTALDQLDDAAAQRLLSLQLSALGPVRFARDVAVPARAGDRRGDGPRAAWASGPSIWRRACCARSSDPRCSPLRARYWARESCLQRPVGNVTSWVC